MILRFGCSLEVALFHGSAAAKLTYPNLASLFLDNCCSQRESVVDALKRCTDTMLAGKTVLICGYGQASFVHFKCIP